MKPALIVGLVLFVVLAIIFVPLIAMWCVDTLFGTNIPVNLKTWFAAFLLLAMIGKGSVSVNKS